MKQSEGQDFVDREFAEGIGSEATDGQESGTRRRGGPRTARSGARFWALAIALLVLNALGLYWIGRDVRAESRDSVRVTQALPVRLVDQARELTLVFDRPLAAPDVIGIDLTESPFRLEPPLEGRWRWSKASELTFELEAPLPPGRVLKLVAEPDFEALTGVRLIGETEFERRTRGLQLVDLRLESREGRAATLTLEFNQPVAPTDLAEALAIHVGAAEVTDLRVITQAAATTLAVRLEAPGTSLEQAIHVTLAEGLHGAGAELGLSKEQSRSITVPRGFAALHARARPTRHANLCNLSLTFSESLALAQELPPLRFTPEVEHRGAHVRGSRLMVEGAFESGRSYAVEVGPSLLSAAGRTLGRASTLHFVVPDRPSDLSLPDGNGILSPTGQLELALRATNVAGIELSASRLHANNLVARLHGGSARETSRTLVSKHIDLDLERNVVTDCALSLRELLDEPLGVYEVRVRDHEGLWNRDSTVVRVSDLTLTAKREAHGVFVWVTSLSSGLPLEGVALEARSYNNQLLGGAISDAQGLAHLRVPEDTEDGGIFVISASLGRDFAYLQPGKRAWVFDEVDTAGRPYAAELDVMLYSDRGAYRPGETIHLTGLLRAPDGSFAAARPLEVQLRRPDGRIDWRARLEGEAEVDAQGLFQLDVPTRTLGPTGVHELVLRDADTREALQTLAVHVETFMAARLEVTAKASVLAPEEVAAVEAALPADTRQLAAGAVDGGPSGGLTSALAPAAIRPSPRKLPARIGLAIDARDFIDRAAAGMKLTVLPTWERVEFESAAFPELTFTEIERAAEASRERSVAGQTQRSRLDDEGRGKVELSLPAGAPAGLWHLSASTMVHEPGGRTVTRRVQAELDTARYHLGFQLEGGASAPVDQDFGITWRLLKPDDTPAAPVEHAVRLERVVSEYGLTRVDGKLVWRRQERHVDEGRYLLGEQSHGELSLHVAAAGSYRLVAQDASGGTVARFEFRAGDPADDREQGDPERLELTLDRHAYAPGDVARLEVHGEFDGQLLVTLETDAVRTSQVLAFEAPLTEVELALPGDLRGGAFVCASLIRPVSPGEVDWLPHRARGLTRVRSDHSDHALPFELELPERARPGERVTVRVQADPPSSAARPARLHVWAVDAGVLQATDEPLPSPHAHYFAQHRSSVRTSDDWADLLPDVARPESIRRIGGDRDFDKALARRLSQVEAEVRDPGVAWSRAVDLAPDGSASVELELPDLRGAVQLRAVLVDGDRYGSLEQRIELSTPLHVTATWPRTCAPGDRFRVPVEVVNTTEVPLVFTLEALHSGPIELGPSEALVPVELAPDAQQRVWFEGRALGLGSVEVELLARAEGIEERARATFAVRPSTPLHAERTFARIEPGEPQTFEPTAGFLPSGLRVRVETSGSPDVELRPALEALLAYPHGCLEQTTSRLFALVHAGHLVGPDREEGQDSALVRSMVRAGLDRLQAMQTRDGGLAYWIGGKRATSWGSAYAGTFLVEARREDYELNEAFLSSLLAYLESQLREAEGGENTRAQICRVLAAFGRPHEGWMTRLGEQLELLDVAGRAHLAAAWLELGRRDRARECLPEGTLALVAHTTASGRLTSHVRQQGALLSALLDLDPAHPWVDPVAARLNEARANGRWRSTLEDAAALAALARYQELREEAGEFRGVLVTEDGVRHEFDSSQRTVFELAGEEIHGRPFTIEVVGEGAAHVLIDVEGLPIAEVAAYDQGLAVRRRLLDLEGAPLDALAVESGDLVLVEVELSAPGLERGARAHNIAIVDTLPAGLEVENPRLANTAAVPGFEAGKADRVEFRDDRVVLFASARAEPVIFRYALRATLAGTFASPPIQASSMYDPGLASLGEAATVRIEAAER